MKRYTVYFSDEDGERIETHKHQFNVSEVARNALLSLVAQYERSEKSAHEEDAAALVAKRLRLNPIVQEQRRVHEEQMAAMRKRASELGAELVSSLVNAGELTFEQLLALDRAPRWLLPADVDRGLLANLQGNLDLRTVPEDLRAAARKAFRDTVHLVIQGDEA